MRKFANAFLKVASLSDFADVCATSGYREPLPSRTEAIDIWNHAVETCHPHEVLTTFDFMALPVRKKHVDFPQLTEPVV